MTTPSREELSVREAGLLLARSGDTIAQVALLLKTAPKLKARAELRRQLSGVLADVETVRLAIKE